MKNLKSLVVGVLAAVVAFSGMHMVSAGSATSSIKLCALKKTGAVRYTTGSCNALETSLVVNQQGVQGSQGAKGDPGPKGDTGAPGAAGANGTNGANGVAGASGIEIAQQSVCGQSGTELCKVGMMGPGGGTIFFVDYHDQYAGFNYLELAPAECEVRTGWSSNNSMSLADVNGWPARRVGSGQANTTAMLTDNGLYLGDDGGAARWSDNLHYEATTNLPLGACASIRNNKSDWYLGSLGEMKLVYDNLQGLSGLVSPADAPSLNVDYYWSSTEFAATDAWLQGVGYGDQAPGNKVDAYLVRPIRSF